MSFCAAHSVMVVLELTVITESDESAPLSACCAPVNDGTAFSTGALPPRTAPWLKGHEAPFAQWPAAKKRQGTDMRMGAPVRSCEKGQRSPLLHVPT
mmetsp:Transcript_30243/g.82731  ORF Transcript_30243/g.82731 Transcript_30243/m.82731 type:complete len:97 (+) Transcript_30243:2676-2966(+)|eukprot:scaffold254473_cov32-Tisochrysis_lutea.AAC.2